MLTIFEYLRKRAQDSVLAGVEDAIAQLDGKSLLTPKSPSATQTVSGPSQPAVAIENSVVAGSDPQKYLAGPPLAREWDDGELPPPRRRGRPRKQEDQP